MKTKAVLLSCLFSLLPLLPLTGQNAGPVFNQPLNAVSRPAFDRVCASLSSRRVIRGDFVQTKTLARSGRSLVSRGFFAVDAGLGMIWDTREPFPSVMAVGSDFITQTSGGRKSRMDAAGNETFIRISGTMSAVFTGDTAKLLEGFEVYFTGTGGNWTMGLIPRDGAAKTFARSIVMQGGEAVNEVTLYEQSGGSVRYELSSQSYGSALSAAETDYFAP
jgi:hypothetical protein